MEFAYSEKEQQHAQILEAVAKPCHSNKSGFKETDKLDAIREQLGVSGYHEILLPNAQIWRKDFTSPIDVLVSSHADFVEDITKPFSSLSENGYYKGTYDNAGTTGAAVISMLEGDIPSNVAFAFTADEETGRCNGAGQALEYATNLGNNPVCIALDVTYEGFSDGALFTVENLSSGNKKSENQDFLDAVGETILKLESEDKKTCSFVRLHSKAIPNNLPKGYIAKDAGWFDEAQFYAKEHAKTFSLCMPSTGNMHSNSGLYVKQPTFEGYINSLESFIYSFSLEPELANTRIEEKMQLNMILFEKNESLVKEEQEAEAKKRAEAKTVTFKGGYQQRSWLDDAKDSDNSYWDYIQGNLGGTPYRSIQSDYDMGYPIAYADSWFDKDIYGDFNSYVESIIEDLTSDAFDYDGFEKYDFISNAESYLPDDFIDWFGGPEKAREVIENIFDVTHEEDKEINRNPKADADGYDYEYTLEDYLKYKEKDERIDELDIIAKQQDIDDSEKDDDYSGYYDDI